MASTIQVRVDDELKSKSDTAGETWKIESIRITGGLSIGGF